MLSKKIHGLGKDVVENEEPVSGVDFFEPSLRGCESDALFWMRAIGMIYGVKEPTKALIELFDGRGGDPHHIAILSSIERRFRPLVR